MDTYKNYQIKWSREDEEYLSQKYSIIKDLDKFQCADFEINESENIKIMPKNLNWNPISIQKNNINNNDENNKDNNKENNNNDNNDIKSENDNNNNIILKNKIISLNDECIILRSIGVEIKISLLMSGESNFYIFSRCINSEFTEFTTICCISKELESARKFISFAVLEKKKGEEGYFIKNLKKQEITHQDNYIKTLDLSEISFVFIDNGDNKCFVFLSKQEQNTNMLLLGDFYEPIEEKCNVMFACSGDLISLKEVEISQVHRDSYVNYRNMNNENIQCCGIF
jgi:hypothetical protein